MSKIEVNALFDNDAIKIVAISKSKAKQIFLHDEKISKNIKNESEIKNRIKSIIKEIEEKTSTPIDKINIIFNDFMKNSEHLNIETKIIEETILFKEGKLLDLDSCKKIINSMIEKSKIRESNEELISLIPFRFIYLDENQIEREISTFPINKTITKLKVILSARYMNKEKFNKIISYFDLLDIKINNVVLESQLSIFESQETNSNYKMKFAISMQEEKTMLVSSSNNVVIKTDLLSISMNNLISKICNEFNVSAQEAKNIINCYGKNFGNLENKNEYVYSSSNIDNNKIVSSKEVIEIVKSFLKTICEQANNIINERIENYNIKNIEVELVGELSNEFNVKDYCSKYFDKVNLCLENKVDNIYNWSNSYMSLKKFHFYIEILNNKINPEVFYQENENKNNIDSNSIKDRTKVFDIVKNKALLA